MDLFEKENNLFDRWNKSWPEEYRSGMCLDGFCYARTPGISDDPSRYFSSTPKIIFVTKDMNNNPGEDIREWRMYDDPDDDYGVDNFYVVLLKLLLGLNLVKRDFIPVISTDKTTCIEQATEYPFINVNLKKFSGGANVDMWEVEEWADYDKAFLKEQIISLYDPTVIFCGGGDSYCRVKDIIINSIYSEYKFDKVNDKCYFSKEKRLLVIDGAHPKARITNKKKMDDIFAYVNDFLCKSELNTLADI